MALHRRRKLKAPGLPELVGALLVCLAIAPAVLWRYEYLHPSYEEAAGIIVDCTRKLTHYNATAVQAKLTVEYEYAVGGTSFIGTWSGFWPQSVEPGSVPLGELSGEEARGLPVKVFYNSRNPSNSVLLYPAMGSPLLYGLLTLAATLACMVYCSTLYPTWTRRW